MYYIEYKNMHINRNELLMHAIWTKLETIKWNKVDTKGHIGFHLHEISETDKSTDTEK